MTKFSISVLLGAMLAGSAQGADLVSAYQDALAYDAQFAGARANLEAGRERYVQGRSGLLPTVGASANTIWNDIDTTLRANPPISRSMQYNSNAWSVNLSQPLFRWQNWAAYKQGGFAVALAEAQFASARQELILRVAQAYFDVLAAQEAVATTVAQKRAITEQLESAKRNFEVGTATITDTHEAKARYDLAVAAELAAGNDLLVKRQALRTVIGKEPEALKTLRAGAQIGHPQPADLEQWATFANDGSLVVAQAQAALAIADQEVAKQRAGHYPTLDLVASHGRSGTGYNTVTAGGTDGKATTVGLQLALPLFAGGYTSSKDREAVALREKALADLDNARRQSALAARQAYLGVTSGLSQVSAYEAALVSSQAALDSNKLGYEVGVRINIDVLNAQSQYYDTRQKLIRARLDTLLAELRLKAAAGTLDETDLAEVNALLE